jgi:hypothetical protein
MCVCVCVWLWLCVYACVSSACVYLHINTQTPLNCTGDGLDAKEHCTGPPRELHDRVHTHTHTHIHTHTLAHTHTHTHTHTRRNTAREHLGSSMTGRDLGDVPNTGIPSDVGMVF